MIIKLPREDIPVEQVWPHYKFITDMHMHYDKMQVKQDFSYVKYVGFFILVSIALIIMQGKGIVSNSLGGIILAGFTVLFASAISMIFISSDIDKKRARLEQEGEWIEERYSSILRSTYFKAFSTVKLPRYKAALLSRLSPFIFAGICTIIAGATYSSRSGINLVILIITLSTAALIASTLLLIKKTRDCQLFFSSGKADR